MIGRDRVADWSLRVQGVTNSYCCGHVRRFDWVRCAASGRSPTGVYRLRCSGLTSIMSSPSPLAPPTPVQIREANAHLAALHGQVTELERRLAAAERTVRDQAESLIRKDAEMRQALLQLRQGKDREVALLEEKLLSSEENAQRLLNVIQEKDSVIAQLKHRSRLLTKICRSRPILDNLLAYMAEGEQLSPVLGARSNGSSPDHDLLLETNCTPDFDLDTREFSLRDDDQDSDKTLFGTTV